MIQMFTPDINRDVFETRAFNVFKDMIVPFKSSLDEYYNNLYSSVEMGRVIEQYPMSPITKIWNTGDITTVYSQWHELYKNIQNIDGLIEFITALYLIADIDIENPAPLVLNFNVNVQTVKGALWNRDSCYNTLEGDLSGIKDDKEPQVFITDDDSATIVFDIKTIDIIDEALTQILQDVVYPGLYYTTDITK